MKPKSMELCLQCIIALEDCGYEAAPVSEGMITCESCGKKCWGKVVKLSKGSGKEERE